MNPSVGSCTPLDSTGTSLAATSSCDSSPPIGTWAEPRYERRAPWVEPRVEETRIHRRRHLPTVEEPGDADESSDDDSDHV